MSEALGRNQIDGSILGYQPERVDHLCRWLCGRVRVAGVRVLTLSDGVDRLLKDLPVTILAGRRPMPSGTMRRRSGSSRFQAVAVMRSAMSASFSPFEFVPRSEGASEHLLCQLEIECRFLGHEPVGDLRDRSKRVPHQTLLP